jgi:putative SOS response-associated peptidase YedK
VCGRYSLAAQAPDIRERFALGEDVPVRQRFNVAPGDEVLVVRRRAEEPPEAVLRRWGLVPFWAKDAAIGMRMINARAEGIVERPAFRDAFARRRCLVIADGFYEWQKTDRGKQPFHVTAPDAAPFAFAGLEAKWRAPDGSELRTCAIVTTRACPALTAVHDRMPVMLPREAERYWLDHEAEEGELLSLLAPLEDVRLRAVSTAVNDARYDGPECLADAQVQTALF